MRRDLLDILACPDCHSPVEIASVTEENDAGMVEGGLRCTACGREFPVIEGIPHMLPSGTEEDEEEVIE